MKSDTTRTVRVFQESTSAPASGPIRIVGRKLTAGTSASSGAGFRGSRARSMMSASRAR